MQRYKEVAKKPRRRRSPSSTNYGYSHRHDAPFHYKRQGHHSDPLALSVGRFVPVGVRSILMDKQLKEEMVNFVVFSNFTNEVAESFIYIDSLLR